MTKEEIEFLNSTYFDFLDIGSSSKTIFNKLFRISKKLQLENEKLKKSNDSRLRVIKELRKANNDLCTEITEMKEAERERIEREYEEFLGEDY